MPSAVAAAAAAAGPVVKNAAVTTDGNNTIHASTPEDIGDNSGNDNANLITNTTDSNFGAKANITANDVIIGQTESNGNNCIETTVADGAANAVACAASASAAEIKTSTEVATAEASAAAGNTEEVVLEEDDEEEEDGDDTEDRSWRR